MVKGNVRVYEDNFENFVTFLNCGYVINSNALIITVTEEGTSTTIFYPFTNIKKIEVTPVEDEKNEEGKPN